VIQRFAPLALALLAAACVTTKELADPTILVHSPDGTELGVSTEFGTVFLGQYARGGEIDVTAWFGDGPSQEASVVEPIGAGLFTAETEIALPAVPLAYHLPKSGTPVVVRGRIGGRPWEIGAEVRVDPRVDGVLLRPGGGLTGAADQIGAGVFVGDEPHVRRLLGLVSGRLRVTDASGAAVDYVAVVGPASLWRLVAHRRELQRKPRWVYREDVL
jgi:hypothetical protein